MKISVIIPVYNTAPFLRICLDSVLAQSRKADEIILVDDGSTDGSADICDEYALKESGIQVIHQENRGAGPARNVGLQRMTGDFVTLIDSDDEIEPDYIASYCAWIEKTGCDTCKGTYRRMKQDGTCLSALQIETGSYRDNRLLTELIPRMLGSAPERKDSIPMGMGVTFYQTGIILENHLAFPEDPACYSEDMIFNLSYLEHAKHVEIIDYAGYHYRITRGSQTNRYMEDRFEKCMLMHQWEKEYTCRLGIYEQCRYRMTRQLFNRMRDVFRQYRRGVCGLTAKESRKELDRIISDPELQELIAQYPIHKMGLPQQVFVYLIKYHLTGAIYLLCCR